MGRLCDYSEYPSQSSYSDEILDLRRRLEELEERVSSSSGQTTPCTSSITDAHKAYSHPLLPFPDLAIQVSFLDSEVWFTCAIPVRTNSIPVPGEIMGLLGSGSDIEDVRSRYFQSVHGWSPIISKIKLTQILEQTRGNLKADTALILLCMKSHPGGSTGTTDRDFRKLFYGKAIQQRAGNKRPPQPTYGSSWYPAFHLRIRAWDLPRGLHDNT